MDRPRRVRAEVDAKGIVVEPLVRNEVFSPCRNVIMSAVGEQAKSKLSTSTRSRSNQRTKISGAPLYYRSRDKIRENRSKKNECIKLNQPTSIQRFEQDTIEVSGSYIPYIHIF